MIQKNKEMIYMDNNILDIIDAKYLASRLRETANLIQEKGLTIDWIDPKSFKDLMASLESLADKIDDKAEGLINNIDYEQDRDTTEDPAKTDLWNEALKVIRSNTSQPSYDTWFTSTKAVSFENNTITVTAPNLFACDWLTSRYMDVIKNAFEELNRPDMQVKFVPKEYVVKYK